MPSPLSDEKMAELSEMIFRGRKIEAIKLYRELTATGLKEAKDAVESLEASLRQTSPEKFSASAGQRGCFGAAAVICLGGMVGTAFWLLT